MEEQTSTQDEVKARLPFYKKANFISILIFVTLAYVAFLLFQAVSANFQTNQKIASLKREIVEVEADRESLQALIAYYQTPAFQELEARKKLGLKMPGEKVVKVDVPESVERVSQEQEQAVDEGVPNYQKWLDFISGNYE